MIIFTIIKKMSQVIECYSKINNDLFYEITTLISEMKAIKLKEKNEKTINKLALFLDQVEWEKIQ